MMKGVFVAVLAFAAVSAALLDTEIVITEELISKINNNPAATWKAGHNSMSGKTVKEVKRMLGGPLPVRRSTVWETSSVADAALAALPATFDARTQWPNCIHPIRDQQQCGSCWAFSASESLSDRFCIASKGSVNVVLSPQYQVSCDTGDMGCQGGQLSNAWSFLMSTGLPSDACVPYTSGGGDSGSCPKTCTDGSPLKLYKAKNAKHISGGLLFWETVAKMQTELSTNGPVQVAFEVYKDFISYTSGVYKHQTGELLGGHAVKLVGWGTENGVAYWLIANSWGPAWGETGFFKIVRGVNECGIEADAWAGLASL
eukprot:ANDGO_05002.mRNA.1 Cathepsin B-like CP2